MAKVHSPDDILERVNACLAGLESELEGDTSAKWPVIHVIGLPRSGTTLLTQLFCSAFEIAYINNLTAAFWRAPLVGAALSEKLLDKPYLSNFNSRFGRTESISEPHEFGYFWREILGYPELAQQGPDFAIDWQRVKTCLSSLVNFYKRPLLFKPFLLGMHAQAVCEQMPHTLIVYVQRSKLEVALSLLKMREEVSQDRNTWVSVKPWGYQKLAHLGFADQIATQVHALDSAFAQQMQGLNDNNLLAVHYDELYTDPRGVLAKFSEKLKSHGHSLPIRWQPDKPFEKSSIMNRFDPKTVEEIKSALAKFE